MTKYQWKVVLALVRVILVIIEQDRTGMRFHYDDLIILREAENRIPSKRV